MTCILTVDVGNTRTRIGMYNADANQEPAFTGSCELTTPARITADEASIHLVQALNVIGGDRPIDAVLSSVVPTLTDAWRSALKRACERRVLIVGPGLKTGLRMRYDDPAEVGSDRVADAVAARASLGAPVIAIDLGTTTNFEIIDEHGAFAGGVIAPGIALGAKALAEAAARLPEIELRAPAHVVGRNTRSAMQSGVVFGEVARIDGLIDRICAEMGLSAPVVLTGEGAANVAALLSHQVAVDEHLTLRGLALIWGINQR